MKYKVCKSVWSKARGLMFSRKKNLVFVFSKEQRVWLHSFFVFFPIDVYFLDENKKIIEKTRLKPFCFYRAKEKAKYVVEIVDKKVF